MGSAAAVHVIRQKCQLCELITLIRVRMGLLQPGGDLHAGCCTVSREHDGYMDCQAAEQNVLLCYFFLDFPRGVVIAVLWNECRVSSRCLLC